MHTEGVLPELAEIEGLRRQDRSMAADAAEERLMPEELWQEASAAAKRLGAGRVARALGLKYETLKQRVISGSPNGARGGAGREKALGRAEFIELREFPVPGLSAGRDEMVVEMLAADGTRLTIRLKGASPGLDGVDSTPFGAAMIQITPQMRVLVAIKPVDFRRGIDGLSQVCRAVAVGGSMDRHDVCFPQQGCESHQTVGL